MALFNFKNNTKVELEEVKQELTTAKTQLSNLENKKTSLLRSISTDNMDLSKPFIDDQFSRGVNWAYFGESNLYPQILNELYLSSPMHSACVDFKTWSIVGDGYEWADYDSLKASDKIAIKHFERHNDFKASFKKFSKDWVKHGRAIALLHYDKEKKEFDSFKIIDPSELRNNRETLFNAIKSYYFANDWIHRTQRVEFTPYSPVNKDEWQIIEIKNIVGGTRTYGLPDWVSSANWQSVSADLGLLHKSALENGIQPSVLFMYPYLMDDVEEDNWVTNMRNNYKGVKNYNRGMKIESNGNEQMPEVKVLETSDNHQLFEQTSKEQKEEIAISHNINPALMGVRVAGSLGATDEIEFSAKQFEKIWLNDNRSIIEDFINDIAVICGIPHEIKINKTEVTEIANAMDSENSNSDVAAPVSDKEADARAQLRGSVGGVQGIIQIQTSVAQGLTDRGSAAALLELIYGFDTDNALRLLGGVKEGDQPKEEGEVPKEVDENGVEVEAAIVNDNLKGLSAKENSDMYRIVRDFNKGRLNKTIAVARLKAYGIDAETAEEILNTEE